MSDFSWGSEPTQFFYELTPDRVLSAVEAAGFRCTGRCLPLNSMENRVYEVELESEEVINVFNRHQYQRVVKFYRPGRWSEAQIKEEHEFLFDLAAAEIPVITPEPFPDGSTVKKMADCAIYYTVFPKRGGRAPEELNTEQLERIGRLLARMHNVGASKEAKNRIQIGPDSYGLASLDFLLDKQLLPMEIENAFADCVEAICEQSAPLFDQVETQRIHGDFHLQNLLWTDAGAMLLDFDDMVRGPCVQDMWLILPGRDQYAQQQLTTLLSAYETMRTFDRSTLKLIEPLRALRMIHFAAWIGKRWDDPAFPKAFPHYGSDRYWRELHQDLQEQLDLIKVQKSFILTDGT